LLKSFFAIMLLLSAIVDARTHPFPVLQTVSVEPSYCVPGKGSVRISAAIFGADSVLAAVYAEIVTSDSMAVDTVQLFDDGLHADDATGDSLYANVWPLTSKNERQYSVNILAQDSIGMRIKWVTDAVFTSIGPLRFKEFVYPENDDTVSPNEQISLHIRLQNNGIKSGAQDVEAVFSIKDAYVRIVGDTIVHFEQSIPALAVATGSNALTLQTAPETPHNHMVECRLKIKSNGHVFWQDSCQIAVIDDKPPLLTGFEMPKYAAPGQTIQLAATFIDDMGVKTARISFQSLTDSTVAQMDLYPNAENVMTGEWTIPETALNNYDIDLSVKDYLNNCDTLVNLAGFTTTLFLKKTNILLVDDDGYNNPDHSPSKKCYESYYQEALDSCNAGYDVYSVYFYGKPDTAVLSLYLDGIVIWETGDTQRASAMDNKYGYVDESCLTPAEVDVLKFYLNHGGRLLLSGQGIGYDAEAYPLFLSEFLGCGVVQQDVTSRRLQTAGHFLTTLFPTITMIKGGSGADNQIHPSGLVPVKDAAQVIFNYTLDQGAAGVSLTRDNGARIVYFGFGFEALEDRGLRVQLMKGILDYLLKNVTVENPPSAKPLPHAYALCQNYPNPFNPFTTIRYEVPRRSHVKISLFNVVGQFMDVLVENEMEPGVHEIKWDASQFPSGIYIVRMESEGFIHIQKLLHIK
jgi:hypothetical protein